jgi:hypothetical protein
MRQLPGDHFFLAADGGRPLLADVADILRHLH